MDATYKRICDPDRSDQQYPLTSARSAPWSGTADPSTPFHSGRDDKGEGCYRAYIRVQGGSAPQRLGPREGWGTRQFSLAQAYYASGQRDKAEESVLASLEAAPGYRPAQKLLLEIEHPEAKD